jgi:thiol:disulfide interchange protein DsbD
LAVEQSAATPGTKVNVGIQFAIESGWHIYWQNPGDSGEPPRIQWKLPAGITAGELKWPTPMRLTTSAGTDYGYQGVTTLLSSLHIPATTQPGTLSVSGDLHWLVCHDVCIPQSAHLETPLHIANVASVNQSAHQLLQSAAERIPTPLPLSFLPVVTTLQDSFRLTLVSSEAITKAELFPSEEGLIDNGAPQELAGHSGKVSLTLKKSEYLREEPQHLRGVLILNERNAYQLDAPVRDSVSRKGSRQK